MKKLKLMLTILPILSLTSCSHNEISIPSGLNKPEDLSSNNSESSNSNENTSSDKYKFESTKLYNDIENSLKQNTLMNDFADGKAYLVLRHALNKQAKSPYSLTIGKSQVKASFLNYTQSITSATLITPTMAFNQNTSTSALVKTAFRFYDEYNGSIDAYEGKTVDDWHDDTKPQPYSYDKYIQAYGKLFQGYYYCTDGGSDIPDKYYTRNTEQFEQLVDNNKREINSVVIYDIKASSIDGCDLKMTDEGYQVTINLNPQKGTYYYQNQMLNTGGLDSKPQFKASILTFNLSKDLYLVSSHFEDSYDFKAVFEMSGVQTMDQYYFHSDNNIFSNGQKKVSVTIPAISEKDFNGYELFLD